MLGFWPVGRVAYRWMICGALLCAVTPALGQVSPSAILNPTLKADEARYLPQLRLLQQAIVAQKFSYPFRLARYLDAHPGQRAALDANGIEFVHFQHRVVLKISGVYQAAFNSERLTENERASQTLQDVVAPILQLVAQYIPMNVDCDGIGMEILYDTRDANSAYDYEGREVLTVVFSREDAFAYPHATGDAKRQEILNRSDIYIDGKDYGLALGQKHPLNVEALDRADQPLTREVSIYATEPVAASMKKEDVTKSVSPLEDVGKLQARYQPPINALIQQDGEKFHLEENAPPTFKKDGNQICLHVTLRNTLAFNRDTSSIYKRAAQSFDLFLAPELKSLLTALPQDSGYSSISFSVQDRFGVETIPSETIDYVSPVETLREFAANKLTSQDVINQSIVLVNGVRISLDLQKAE